MNEHEKRRGVAIFCPLVQAEVVVEEACRSSCLFWDESAGECQAASALVSGSGIGGTSGLPGRPLRPPRLRQRRGRGLKVPTVWGQWPHCESADEQVPAVAGNAGDDDGPAAVEEDLAPVPSAADVDWDSEPLGGDVPDWLGAPIEGTVVLPPGEEAGLVPEGLLDGLGPAAPALQTPADPWQLLWPELEPPPGFPLGDAFGGTMPPTSGSGLPWGPDEQGPLGPGRPGRPGEQT